MDNILKLLLGVLSVAGLIAMLTPTNLAVQPPAQAVVSATPAIAPLPSQNADALLPEEIIEEEVEDDPFSMGEPIIDGNPINQQGQQGSVNSERSPPQAPAYDPASYGVPTISSYAAPPVYNVPIGEDGYAQDSPAQ